MDIKKLKLTKKLAGKELQGSIDSIDSGNLVGWAAVIGSSAPLSVAAYTGAGTLLGSGIANIPRNDLKEHGINQGNHGFDFPVSEDLLEPGSSLVLKTLESNEVIHTNEFVIPKLDKTLSARIENIHLNKLSFSIWGKGPIGNATVRFKSGGIVFCDKQINSQSSLYSGFIWLPAALLNGAEHVVEILVVGNKERIGWGLVQSDPFLTPVEYIQHSNMSAKFIGRQAGADWRYESLTLQLDQVNFNHDRESFIKNISTAHRVLVESHVGRTDYPTLVLPKSDKPLVSIIIPTYNKFELVYHAIASIILAFNKASFEVIVADDCSTDATSRVEEIVENVVVSRNAENLRFLLSCNRAAELAKGQYIVFLNNDTEVKSMWLDALIEQHQRDSKIALTGSKLLNTDGSLQEAGGIIWGNGEAWNAGRNQNPFAPEWNYVRDVDYLTGAAMCIRNDVWLEVGGFSEELAPCYYEDADLAFKVREAGYRTVYVPHSEVIHFEGMSHGTDTSSGLKAYQVVNEKTFRSKWFKSFKNRVKPSLTNLQLEKDRNIEQRVLVIDYAIPEPNKDAGGYAAVEEMKLMLALGFKVTFVPDNLAHMGKFTRNLEALGIEVLYVPFYTSIKDVLFQRLEEMDAVYITRYSIAEKYIDEIQEAGKPVIFNNADLHFLREIRAAMIGKEPEALELALETKEAELAVCKKADAVLCYNSKEHAVITSHIYESDKLFITPWVLGERNFYNSFEERDGICFLGGFNHLPNIEAMEYLATQVMPILAKIAPEIVLYVYGSKMPKKLKEFTCENIKMIGFAESLDDVFNDHKVFVSPLLSGAGIKGKVLESMAYGTPVVLTEVAAEGTGLTNNINAFLAENAEQHAQAIKTLYYDAELWNQFSKAVRQIASRQFSKQHGVKQFKKIFESIGVYSSLS